MSIGEKHTTGEGGIGSVFGRLTDSLREAIFVENPKGDAGSSNPNVTPNQPTAATQAAASAADNPMTPRLHEAVMSRATGFRQLATNMQALEKVIPDETSRLRAAFAVLQQSGGSIPNLLQDIDLHARDLETQSLRFREESDRERKQRVGQREKSLEDAKSLIDAAQLEVNRQQEIIDAQQKKITHLKVEIQNQTAELDRASEQFSAAVEHEKNWLAAQSKNVKALATD
ncbi:MULTISPECIES: hypothetical protein [Caballeronia]|uniref:Uncharacterized protein n=1 Tax=Caballeronia zhejiangensis TaxID=871203 RepID=A0A656QPF5_9BURK|nr:MULTISPECIES: hypothetical protein [Caballeronia]EKS66752.1 hypothetical protein BURK_032939 [Burkholderia sp. SJ98]KDR31033.1 hypothetical protein BG60_35355 [Caballeronia zhejiangensis]MDR5789970.1 hypothetical protein [Caballeronia sp. LP003]